MAFGGGQAVVGSFGARLGLDTGDYARGILNAQGMNRVFGESFATFISNPLLGSIELFKRAGQALVNYGSDVLEQAENIALFAQEVNASTTFVQALRAQYQGAGRDVESSTRSLKEAVTAIQEAKEEGTSAAEALAEIGVSLEGVTTTDEAVRRIVAGLSGVENAARRTHLAMELLGRSGGSEFLAIVGNVDQMIDRAKTLGAIVREDTIAALGGLDGLIDDISQAAQGAGFKLMAEFLSGFAGADLSKNKDALAEIATVVDEDLAPAMKELGEGSREIVELLRLLGPLLPALTEFLRVAADGATALSAVATRNGPAALNAVRELGSVAAQPLRPLSRIGQAAHAVHEFDVGSGYDPYLHAFTPSMGLSP